MVSNPSNAGAIPRPKRRWFRYSLRTLLLVFTITCIWLAWTVNAAREQRAAVEAIKALGGTALYDYEIGPDGLALDPSPDPGWLAKWLGVDFLHHVVYVNLLGELSPWAPVQDFSEVMPHLQHLTHVTELVFGRGNLSDDDLRCLAPLTSLKEFSVYENRLTGRGFQYLTNLKNLSELRLFDTPIKDEGLKFIAKFPRLEVLFLESTEITDTGVAYLPQLQKLRILNLPGNLITDGCVQSLSLFPNLNAMSLDYTPITPDGVQKLAQLKPSLLIYCAPTQTPPEPGQNVKVFSRYMRSREDRQTGQ